MDSRALAEHAILAAPLLLVAFPLLVVQEPLAASPLIVFAPLFALVTVIVWRSFAEPTARLYFVAALLALATEAAWSARYLTPDTLAPALVAFVAFALLYLGVPQFARWRGAPLEPKAGPGIVLILGLMLLMYFADARMATAGLWGMALLLAILNAALFIESASTSLPFLALAGSLVSWVVLGVWWGEAAADVGLLSSLLVVVGLSLVMVGGYIWGLRYAAPVKAADDADAACPPHAQSPRVGDPGPRGNGLWLALVGHLFLFGVASNLEWAIPPWPLFGAMAVITLAFSVAALAARNPAIHAASVVMSAVILVAWRAVTQSAGHAPIAIVRVWRADAVCVGVDRRHAPVAEICRDHRGCGDHDRRSQSRADDWRAAAGAVCDHCRRTRHRVHHSAGAGHTLSCTAGRQPGVDPGRSGRGLDPAPGRCRGPTRS